MKSMLAAVGLLCGAAVRRVCGGIHLGSGLSRIGIVDVHMVACEDGGWQGFAGEKLVD